jgi:hypothetical protein
MHRDPRLKQSQTADRTCGWSLELTRMRNQEAQTAMKRYDFVMAKKNSLVNNINKRKKAGKSRPKSKSSVGKESYSEMEKGWSSKKKSSKSSKKSTKKSTKKATKKSVKKSTKKTGKKSSKKKSS